MIKYVIFDCDGVLVDTEIVAARLMVKRLKAMRCLVSEQDYIYNYSGKTFRLILESYIADGLKIPKAFLSIDHMITDLEAEVSKNIVAIPGIQEVLSKINGPKAIVSNSKKSHVVHIVDQLGISAYFGTNIFSASMVDHPKPSPLVYLHAANTLGVKPSDCLVIEDSISGAKAAVAAGMTTLGFTGAGHILPGHDKRLLSLGVKETFSHMNALPEIIEKLRSTTSLSDH